MNESVNLAYVFEKFLTAVYAQSEKKTSHLTPIIIGIVVRNLLNYLVIKIKATVYYKLNYKLKKSY